MSNTIIKLKVTKVIPSSESLVNSFVIYNSKIYKVVDKLAQPKDLFKLFDGQETLYAYLKELLILVYLKEQSLDKPKLLPLEFWEDYLKNEK